MVVYAFYCLWITRQTILILRKQSKGCLKFYEPLSKMVARVTDLTG